MYCSHDSKRTVVGDIAEVGGGSRKAKRYCARGPIVEFTELAAFQGGFFVLTMGFMIHPG